MDIDPLIIEAEARERMAAEQAAYARGYADALRALRAAILAAQQAAEAAEEAPPAEENA